MAARGRMRSSNACRFGSRLKQRCADVLAKLGGGQNITALAEIAGGPDQSVHGLSRLSRVDWAFCVLSAGLVQFMMQLREGRAQLDHGCLGLRGVLGSGALDVGPDRPDPLGVAPLRRLNGPEAHRGP